MFVPLLTLGVLFAILVLAAAWTLLDWAADFQSSKQSDKDNGPT